MGGINIQVDIRELPVEQPCQQAADVMQGAPAKMVLAAQEVSGQSRDGRSPQPGIVQAGVGAAGEKADHLPVRPGYLGVLRFQVGVIGVEGLQEHVSAFHVGFDRRLEEGGISPDAEDGFPVGGLKGTGEQVWHRLRSVDMNHLPAGFILDPPSTHSISSHEDSPGIPQVGQ